MMMNQHYYPNNHNKNMNHNINIGIIKNTISIMTEEGRTADDAKKRTRPTFVGL